MNEKTIQFDSYEEFRIGDVVYSESAMCSGQIGMIERIRWDEEDAKIWIEVRFNENGFIVSKLSDTLSVVECRECKQEKIHSSERDRWFCPWCEK